MTETDPKYPIYRVSVRWEQDGEQNEKYPKWSEGLPEGRIWNGTGFSRMFKEDPGQESVLEGASAWWIGYSEEMSDKNPGAPEFTVTGPKFETWCLNWFQHYTFDDGRSDKEFLASFSRYVSRYAHMQDHPDTDRENYQCLMGAEDRWRWHGADHDSPAPCRCKHCIKQGIVRIGH